MINVFNRTMDICLLTGIICTLLVLIAISISVCGLIYLIGLMSIVFGIGVLGALGVMQWLQKRQLNKLEND